MEGRPERDRPSPFPPPLFDQAEEREREKKKKRINQLAFGFQLACPCVILEGLSSSSLYVGHLIS